MPPNRGLSLTLNDWTTLAYILQDTEWRSSLLDSLHQDSIPTAPGVYILLTQPQLLSDRYHLPTHLAPVVYVGQTHNLRRRFLNHARHSSADKLKLFKAICGTLRYVFTPVPLYTKTRTDNWLSEAERALVVVLDPPANKVVPLGKAVQARLGDGISVPRTQIKEKHK